MCYRKNLQSQGFYNELSDMFHEVGILSIKRLPNVPSEISPVTRLLASGIQDQWSSTCYLASGNNAE